MQVLVTKEGASALCDICGERLESGSYAAVLELAREHHALEHEGAERRINGL